MTAIKSHQRGTGASLQDSIGSDRQEPFPSAVATHARLQHRPGGGPVVVLDRAGCALSSGATTRADPIVLAWMPPSRA